eukprot:NODE_26135_length_563_cov_0.814220.p4 GENE.NODE_26135_length_563_cov_0.814220~~NODE_26135_length_563_cov_0.814220.p4  ORF type:complete len:74 (+),score=48.81 NODE_26135_length_563_cov_0.814220:267-488(+)
MLANRMRACVHSRTRVLGVITLPAASPPETPFFVFCGKAKKKKKKKKKKNQRKNKHIKKKKKQNTKKKKKSTE